MKVAMGGEEANIKTYGDIGREQVRERESLEDTWVSGLSNK